MPRPQTYDELVQRRQEREAKKQAAKEAKYLPAEELEARRRVIYGDTPGGRNQVKKLKTRGHALTLAEGRKPREKKATAKGKQISVRLDLDVEKWANSHAPMSDYINSLIRADMIAHQND